MTLKNPGIFFRGLILGAQGVFYNMFFVSLFAWKKHSTDGQSVFIPHFPQDLSPICWLSRRGGSFDLVSGMFKTQKARVY
jgi:hypothetical protein